MPSNRYKQKCLHINVYITKINKYIYIHTIVTAEVFQWCLSIKVMSTHFFYNKSLILWTFQTRIQTAIQLFQTAHNFPWLSTNGLCISSMLAPASFIAKPKPCQWTARPPFQTNGSKHSFKTSPYRIRQLFNNKPLKCFFSWLATTRLLKNWLMNTYEIIRFYNTG